VLSAQYFLANSMHGLSFSESIYFSIGIMRTVGYRDIIPYSNLARVLPSLEVLLRHDVVAIRCVGAAGVRERTSPRSAKRINEGVRLGFGGSALGPEWTG